MKHLVLLIVALLVWQLHTIAQDKPRKEKLLHRIPTDTTGSSMNIDATYNRPFLQFGKVPVALGGYAEMKAEYIGTNGKTDGFSFRFQRLTLFVSSTIHRRIKFLSEIEFEGGAKEINIEFASVDVEFHPMCVLRAGIVMNPIGAFNQNHDGPKWEFTDRPIMATQLLPATFSNVGAGFYGKAFKGKWSFAYEAYLTNGFNDNIIANTQNRTFLPATKDNIERFEESSNGIPLLTAKVSLKHRHIGELGISYMGGVYNTFRRDGLVVDTKRRVDVAAIDFNTTLPRIKTRLNAEWAMVLVDVPGTYTQQFGSRQQGAFLDIVQPVYTLKMKKRKHPGDFVNSTFNIACRVEYVDWNWGRFNETNGNIGDYLLAITPGISWRPGGQTVLRLNYLYQWQYDLLGNAPAKSGGFRVGIASYF